MNIQWPTDHKYSYIKELFFVGSNPSLLRRRGNVLKCADSQVLYPFYGDLYVLVQQKGRDVVLTTVRITVDSFQKIDVSEDRLWAKAYGDWKDWFFSHETKVLDHFVSEPIRVISLKDCKPPNPIPNGLKLKGNFLEVTTGYLIFALESPNDSYFLLATREGLEVAIIRVLKWYDEVVIVPTNEAQNLYMHGTTVEHLQWYRRNVLIPMADKSYIRVAKEFYNARLNASRS